MKILIYSLSSNLSPKLDLSPVFFWPENVTNREPRVIFRKNSKFICNEILFFNKVIGKFRLDLVHFTNYFSIFRSFFKID